MKNYYFTFGASPNYPFYKGYVLVNAATLNDAVNAFDAEHEPIQEGIVNCAFMYNEIEFQMALENLKNAPGCMLDEFNYCHEVIHG